MKRVSYIVFAIFFWFLHAQSAVAHDPVFGFGAHVIYKGGYELELEYEGEKAGAEKENKLAYTIGYGITPDFTISLSVPQILKKENGSASSSGVGDMSIGGKYRFFTNRRTRGTERPGYLSQSQAPIR